MDARKAEFKRLIKIMGWSQTEAAKRLGKTPSAINHLVNPHHTNKPTQTTFRLLKMMIAKESPGRSNTRAVETRETGRGDRAGNTQFTAKERNLIERLRELPARDRDKACEIIRSVLSLAGRNNRKKN